MIVEKSIRYGYDRYKVIKYVENEREMVIFMISNLCELVNSVMGKIKERKVFDVNIRNEMVGFRFELDEEF